MMILNTIELEAMEQVARKQANRQLSRYLCETLAAVIPRLPSRPDYVEAFVGTAGTHAITAGFAEGKAYSTHIMLSFLLGLGWENDIAGGEISPVLADAGLPYSRRLDVAVNMAVAARLSLEKTSIQLHPVSLALLAIAPEKRGAADIWQTFSQLATLRGIHDVKQITRIYHLYEQDACRVLQLPMVEHRKVSAYDLAGMRYMGAKEPDPSDDLNHLSQQQLTMLAHFIILAMSFGRYFHANPLFADMHRVIDPVTDIQLSAFTLQQSLQQHLITLREDNDG